MKCSDSMMKYTGYLHILALAIAIYGTYTQIDSVKSGKAYSPALAIALTVMLLLRIPNQICVALHESHGWYSVVGSALGLIGYIALTVVTFQKSKTDPDEQTPPAVLLSKQQQSFV